jgi:hypothetical protein
MGEGKGRKCRDAMRQVIGYQSTVIGRNNIVINDLNGKRLLITDHGLRLFVIVVFWPHIQRLQSWLPH